MTDYQRRATPALVYQFAGQPRSEWPQWMQDYTAFTQLGAQPITAALGVMMLPTRGLSINVNPTDYVVLEGYELKDEKVVGGIAGAYTRDTFADAFEEVGLTV